MWTLGASSVNQLELAFFANAAEVSEKGTLNVLSGGIDVINGPMFPAPLQTIYVIAKVVTTPSEVGNENDSCVRVLAPDVSAISADVHLKFKATPHPRNRQKNNWVMLSVNYQNLVIPAPGEYAFQLSVNDKSLGRIVLEAVKT